MIETYDKNLPVSGLVIELTRAPLIIIIIYSVFFLLILTACYISIPAVSLFLCAVLIIIAYGQYLFRKSLLRTHPLAINKMVFTELGWCHIKLNNGEVIKADIQENTVVSEYLVILNMNKQSELSVLGYFFNHSSVILTAQELGCEPFRKLKRYLRLINFSKKEET